VKSLGRGVIDFVVGDDVWVAVLVLVLLATAAFLVHVGAAPFWLLPVGVPAVLWGSLDRARRRAASNPGP
jgi:hypothetical protein